VGHSSLLVARVLRLTGVSLLTLWLSLTSLLYFLSFSNPSPGLGRFFLIGIVVALVSAALGFPLVFIGNHVSPPDPWLDFWLDLRRFRKSLRPPSGTEVEEGGGGIWATIESDNDRGRLEVKGKCFVKFEPNHLVLEQSGKDLVLIDEPKKVSRTGNFALLVDTGLLGYGRITFTFNSASDADTVEREATKLVKHK